MAVRVVSGPIAHHRRRRAIGECAGNPYDVVFRAVAHLGGSLERPLGNALDQKVESRPNDLSFMKVIPLKRRILRLRSGNHPTLALAPHAEFPIRLAQKRAVFLHQARSDALFK